MAWEELLFRARVKWKELAPYAKEMDGILPDNNEQLTTFIQSRGSIIAQASLNLLKGLVGSDIYSTGPEDSAAEIKAFIEENYGQSVHAIAEKIQTQSEQSGYGKDLTVEEVQRITALKWSELSLNSAASWTAKSASSTDPSSYLSAGKCDEKASLPQYEPCYEYDWGNTGVKEPLVAAGSGYDATTDPYSFTTVAANGTTRISGSVYRYITWVDDEKCEGVKNTCGGSNDDKRITVAVTVAGLRKPVIVSTLYSNPEGSANNPLVDGSKCVDGGVEGSCTH